MKKCILILTMFFSVMAYSQTVSIIELSAISSEKLNVVIEYSNVDTTKVHWIQVFTGDNSWAYHGWDSILIVTSSGIVESTGGYNGGNLGNSIEEGKLYNTCAALFTTGKVEQASQCKSFTADFSTTGVEDLFAEHDKSVGFKIYPNPARNILNIKNTGEKIENVCIYNITGELIKEILMEGNEVNVSVNDLPSGIYFVKDGMNARSSGARFVIQ